MSTKSQSELVATITRRACAGKVVYANQFKTSFRLASDWRRIQHPLPDWSKQIGCCLKTFNRALQIKERVNNLRKINCSQSCFELARSSAKSERKAISVCFKFRLVNVKSLSHYLLLSSNARLCKLFLSSPKKLVPSRSDG